MHLVKCLNEKLALKNGITQTSRATNQQEKIAMLENEIMKLR